MVCWKKPFQVLVDLRLAFFPKQKFGTIRADVIEQMRFKQRLRVIQTIEDTTKRNVVKTPNAPPFKRTRLILRGPMNS